MNKIEEINQPNIDAYEKERDELLKSHPGQYAAYCEGKRILIGTNEHKLYAEVRSRFPKEAILLCKIIPRNQEPVYELRTPSFGRLEKQAKGEEGK